MNSILLYLEIITNGYRVKILDFISLAAILCGTLVVISNNPVVSVLFLIELFLCISGILISSDFLINYNSHIDNSGLELTYSPLGGSILPALVGGDIVIVLPPLPGIEVALGGLGLLIG